MPDSTPAATAPHSAATFVSVFNLMGIPYAEDFIRFVIITALLSTANSGLYAASRMMWALSAQNQLPRVSPKSANPACRLAVWVTMIGGLPGLLSEQFGADVIFKNLMGVAAFTMVIVWMSICWSQFNFRRQWLRQGRDASELKFRTRVPAGAYSGLYLLHRNRLKHGC